jgi:predicted ATPase
LFLYKNSPDLEVQERFEQLRAAVREPELGIGIVNVSVQPDQKLNVRTRQNGLELDLEQRGSGIQQLLTLLALCHRGRILAIEEPEMNLSEPNQRLLWKKLREFTGEKGPMDQVFVTSHSRVFEEEAERLIVSRDPQLGTDARWAEPAPASKQADIPTAPSSQKWSGCGNRARLR